MAILGERWTFVVLREVFNGVRRFDDMRQHTSIPRQVLTDRLALLVEHGILRKEPYKSPGERARHEYRLTDKGIDLYPVLISIAQWGDRYLADPAGPPVQFAHRDCDARDADGRDLSCGTRGGRPPPDRAAARPRRDSSRRIAGATRSPRRPLPAAGRSGRGSGWRRRRRRSTRRTLGDELEEGTRRSSDQTHGPQGLTQHGRGGLAAIEQRNRPSPGRKICGAVRLRSLDATPAFHRVSRGRRDLAHEVAAQLVDQPLQVRMLLRVPAVEQLAQDVAPDGDQALVALPA